jgi:Bacterial membrane protein YfhO
VAGQPEPNIGDVYGIESVWGGGATVLTAYSQLGSREDLLNVRYYIKPASVPDPGPVYQDAGWKVYENPNAYPRGWVVHQAVVAPTHEAAFRRLDQPGTNLHQIAVLETPLPRSLAPAAGTEESVRFRSYEADRMAMDVNAGSAGLLVLSEMYYPGWVATVNGKAAKIYQVDGALRGIAVARGPNRIELEYAPSSFRAGAALSLLTLACVLAGWVYARKHGAVRVPLSVRAV